MLVCLLSGLWYKECKLTFIVEQVIVREIIGYNFCAVPTPRFNKRAISSAAVDMAKRAMRDADKQT